MLLPRAVLAPVTVLAIAVGLAACGEEGGGEQPAVTRQQFAQQANQICRQADQGVEQAAAQLQGASAPDALRQSIDRLERSIQDPVGRLGSLPRPEGPEGDVARRYQEALRRQVEELAPFFAQAREAAPRGARAVRRVFERDFESSAGDEADRLAQQLGATVCAGE